MKKLKRDRDIMKMNTDDLHKSNIKKIIWICVAAVVLLGIVVAVIFMVFGDNKSASAYAKLSNGEYSEAIDEFDKLIIQNDKNIEAYAGKAMAQMT